VKNVLEFISDADNYVSMLGPVEYHMGRHLERVHRFRSVQTQDGYTIANKSGRYRYGPIRGEAIKPIGNVLRHAGYITGAGGIIYTGYQYLHDEIPLEKAILDGVFGVVGFCGLPGMVISLVYFSLISPHLDKDKLMNLRVWDGSLARDNTRVAIPDPSLGMPIPFRHQLPISERPSYSPFWESPEIRRR